MVIPSRTPRQAVAQRRRIATVVLGAALTVLGIALGAQLQHEEHLPPDATVQQESNQNEATGNIIPATAILAAGGITLVGVFLAQPGLRNRWVGGGTLFGSVYVLINLLQTGWPSATVLSVGADRAGRFGLSLLAFNGPGLATVFLPIFAAYAAALLGLLWSWRHLQGLHGKRDLAWTPPSPAALLRRHLGACALALPFYAVAVWALLKLILAMAGTESRGVAYGILSLAALACLGVLAVELAKGWQLAAVGRHPVLAPAALEAWQGLARVEAGLAGAFLLLAAGGALLPRADLDLLQPGTAFRLTLRSHTVLLAALAVPLAALMAQNTGVQAELRQRPASPERDAGFWWLAALTGAAVAGAGLATFAAPGALWPWLAAAVPAAALGVRAGPGWGALATGLAAFASWAAGSTLAARVDFADTAQLAWDEPGLGALALLRLAGALLFGFALVQATRGVARGARGSTLIPLGGLVAVAGAGILLLELPLDVWVVTSYRGFSIAQGSALAKQDLAVAIVMHLAAFLLAAGAAVALARLVRPDWFNGPPQRPRPFASSARGPARA